MKRHIAHMGLAKAVASASFLLNVPVLGPCSGCPWLQGDRGALDPKQLRHPLCWRTPVGGGDPWLCATISALSGHPMRWEAVTSAPGEERVTLVLPV